MGYPPLWSSEVELRVRASAYNRDKQERPTGEVRMCARCVITNQRPRIVFDNEGVCSACRYSDSKRDGTVDWFGRQHQLQTVIERAKQSPYPYNVVVPASGGKDSSFVAWTMREKGLRPLLARWAPHIPSAIGERNWQSLLHSGFDGVTAQPNGLLHRKLSRLALEYFGDPFLPFIYGQLAWPFHVAVQNHVEFVFFGENGEAEYGGDPSANDKPRWDSTQWTRVYMKGGDILKLLEIGWDLGAISNEELERASPFYQLQKPSPDVLPEFHWLGYYLPWHPQGNYYHAVENTGFEPQEQRSEGTFSRYASIDDELDGLHYWFAYLKFGIGRCTSDAAQEVRNGDLTREEALALVKKYDAERPERHLKQCLSYLGTTNHHLLDIEARFRL